MRAPTRRLALTGSAVIILAVLGIGLAAAANGPSASTSNLVPGAATPRPASTAALGRPSRERLGGAREAFDARLVRIGRHLVHVEATVTDKDGNLVVVWLDHGTVASFAGGSLTLSEAGGGTKTVAADGTTIVRVGRNAGTLADVTNGDEVFVQSRVDGGKAIAKRILIIPARLS